MMNNYAKRGLIMRILGIDPGFAIVGIGIIEYVGNKFKVIDYTKITTEAHTDFPERLKIIYNELNCIIDAYKPDAISIEELFFNNNAKTAINVGQGRGIALLCGALHNIPIFEYTPLQIKQAVVGYGRASKDQVQQMVKVLLNLDKIPKPDDVADALAVAVCHAHSYKMNSKIPGGF